MAESAVYTRRGFSGAARDTTLAAGINASATSFAGADLSTWTTTISNGPARATITDGTNEEEFEYTGISTNTFTGVTRGVGGTTAQAWDSGVTIFHGSSARDFDEANYVVAETVGKITAANQLLVSDGANSLTALSVAASRIVGRKASGDIVALTAAEAAAIIGSPTVTKVRKSADESVTSSTTLQDDNELTFAIGASETWVFEMGISVVGNTTGDFKAAITVPASGTLMWAPVNGVNIGFSPTDAAADDLRSDVNTTSGSGITFGITNFATLLVVKGSVLNSTNAGNVTLQWAQATSDATATTVKAGSYLIAHKVG